MDGDIELAGGIGPERRTPTGLSYVQPSYEFADGPVASTSLGQAAQPIRRLARAERTRPHEVPPSFEVGLHWSEPDARPVATLLDSLDREFRRIPALAELLRQGNRSDPLSLPLPRRPERAGLRVAEAKVGSPLSMWLFLYGELEDLASTSPVEVMSLLMLLWDLGRISKRLVERWSLRSDSDAGRALTGGRRKALPVFKEVVDLGNEAIAAGYREIELVGEAEGIRLEIRIRK